MENDDTLDKSTRKIIPNKNTLLSYYQSKYIDKKVCTSKVSDKSDTVEDDNRDILDIVCWNVNGMKRIVEEGHYKILVDSMNIDILCMNEIKISDSDIDGINKNVSYKNKIYNTTKTSYKDYSGVCVLSDISYNSVVYGMNVDEHDREGRMITMEYDKFYLVCVYVPNSGMKLNRLQYRVNRWDVDMMKYIRTLREKKPTFIVGDMNVAHTSMDIHNSSSNKKRAGHTEEERESFSRLISDGWVDVYRKQHPFDRCYTFYTSRRDDCKKNNIGWRLDYILSCERAYRSVVSSHICRDIDGSDHVPIKLSIDMNKL